MYVLFLIPSMVYSQGFNHTWLLGYWPYPDTLGRINFTTSAEQLQLESRKMKFSDTQANISDSNGIFLMSSNGSWIANSQNDTMVNGNGLLTKFGYSPTSNGTLVLYSNLILPNQQQTSKYVLIHHDIDTINSFFKVRILYQTKIDMTLDSGRGAVLSKNDTLLADTLNSSIAACSHANGRDWWIIASKDSSDILYSILLTPNGVDTIISQHTNISPVPFSNICQPTFSPDGKKFVFSFLDFNGLNSHYVYLLDFDRCTGLFSNTKNIDITDGYMGFGTAFAANSKYLYACSTYHIYQWNTDTINVQASVQIVATNDTFYSPSPPFATNFFAMYLAANGKIYITSTNGVLDLHYINYPDSAGIGCEVHLHDYHLPFFNYHTVPNHPNYYLGCDTTSGCPCLVTNVSESTNYDFKFRVYPNPISNNNLHIGYLLPQNKAGVFQIYDVTGKLLFKYNLPQWSNEQSFSLPTLSNGVYNCVITSNNFRVSKNLVVIKE